MFRASSVCSSPTSPAHCFVVLPCHGDQPKVRDNAAGRRSPSLFNLSTTSISQQQRGGVPNSLPPPMSFSISSQGLSSSPCTPSTQHFQPESVTTNRQHLRRGRRSRRSSSYSGRPLASRYNKSCDWLGPGAQLLHQQDDGDNVLANNPIAQVSSDILRASGYTQQFKNLLSAGPRTHRRDSTSEQRPSTGGFCKQQSLEERCNGDLHGQFGPGVAKSLEWNLSVEEAGGAVGRKVSAQQPPGGTQAAQLQQQQQQQHRQIRRRQSGYGISITTESQAKMRCKLRKLYFVKRNKICDLSLALAIVGLAFVMMDQELTANKWIGKHSAPSLMLRSLCVSSTLMLIASLINYHRTEVNIALIDSGAEDWRVALTTDRVIKLFIEVAICAVCPFPGSGNISWPYIQERRITTKIVPLDVLLSVPMFLRAYLLCRFMVLHSRQFQDAATRSIAALNRISMDFRFVIKTMMADHPMTVLVVFTVSYWICMSWMFTQCERYNEAYTGGTEMAYSNSVWFIMVTFMSIGYGDVVPTSYCGRFLSITTGIVGAGVSSALIAVISRKLELSRAEKHVNNFMADSKLTNARKNAAAAVLQHTWFIHKYQQRNGHKGDELRLRQHQRKFLNAINDFRRIKWDQRKLQEKGNSLLDVGKLHTEMHETLWEMHRTQETFAGMIEVLTKRIVELQATVVAVSQGQQPPQSAIKGGGAQQQNNNNNQQQQQLRVPGGAGDTDTSMGTEQQHQQRHHQPTTANPTRKYSGNHHQHHHIPSSEQHHQQHNHHHPHVGKPLLLDAFSGSNPALANSSSSPCLQKTMATTARRPMAGDEPEAAELMCPLMTAEEMA